MPGFGEHDGAASRLGKVELGSFRLLRVLGQGAFATAYVAEQLGTDRMAVVKVAHPHLLRGPSGDMVRERFVAEVRASTRVSQRNVVTVFSAGETHDGIPALAMEHLEGVTLGQRLDQQGRLEGEETVRVFSELAEALRTIHRARIVHRDLSPENVFLSRDFEGGTVTKVLDFGVAKLLDAPGENELLFGTPRYMSPEQVVGKAETATDMYAVGALLHYALTGHELYEDVADFVTLSTRLRRAKAGIDPREIEPRVPSDVAIFVQSLLHPTPAERPNAATFAAVWGALSDQVCDFMNRRRRSQVAALLRPAAVNETLVRRLRAAGHVVRVDASLRLSSLVTDEVESVVIDADLPRTSSHVDALGLARQVAEVSPGSALFVVSSRPLSGEWSRIDARLHALLPEQLDALVGAIGRGDAATSSRWSNFTGEMAENIAHLGAALEELETGELGPLVRACEAIERHAHVLGARDLGSIARTLRMLAIADELHDGLSFFDDIQSEYRAQFRRLGTLARGDSGATHP